MKLCSRCKQTKPLDEFFRQQGTPTGRHSQCKPCYYLHRGERKPIPKDRRLDQNLRRKYGIGAAEVKAKIAAQGGVCAICCKPMKRPCVDHNHATGQVRDVLCHPCNIALHAIESQTFREAALAYLQKWEQK